MRAGICAAVSLFAIAVGWTGQAALAQDNPNPEQQKKMYEDALQQLKAAQERKNQLAAENEKLKQQIDALSRDVAAKQAALEELRLVDAAHAEKTFFLRSHYMAWQEFTKSNPDMGAKWRLYLQSAYLLSGPGEVSVFDREWPLRVEQARPATQPTTVVTQPSPDTQPATHPAAPPAATQPAATAPATQPSMTAPAAATAPTVQPAPATQAAASATQPATAP